MNERQFFIQLTILSIGVCLFLFLLNIIPLFAAYQQVSWLSVFLFIVISIAMYFLGKWAINHPNKNLFTNLLYLFMGGKMFLSIILIYSYNLIAEPKTKLFIIPFFVVYIFYTIFESHFLIKLNNSVGD